MKQLQSREARDGTSCDGVRLGSSSYSPQRGQTPLCLDCQGPLILPASSSTSWPRAAEQGFYYFIGAVTVKGCCAAAAGGVSPTSLLSAALQQSLIHTQQGLVHLSEKNHLSLLKFVDSCFVFFAQILGCHEYRLHDLTAHLYLRFFHALPQSLIHVRLLPISL